MNDIQNDTNHHNGNGKLSTEIRKITGEITGGEHYVHAQVISMKLDLVQSHLTLSLRALPLLEQETCLINGTVIMENRTNKNRGMMPT